MIPLDAILDRLDHVRPRPAGGYTACCPAHEDRAPSLSIDRGADGRILLYCFAGCSIAAIVDALGLTLADLSPDPGAAPAAPPRPRPARHQAPAPTPATPAPRRVRRVGETWYDLRDVDGAVVASHRREVWLYDDGQTRKALTWWQPDQRTPTLAGRATSDLPLYGAERLAAWPALMPVALVEGERAATALWEIGLAAVGTVTGASGTPSPAVLAALAGRIVVLWPDADEPGRGHSARIGAGLAGIAAELRWFDWRGAPAGGDAVDWIARYPDPVLTRVVLDTAPAWTPPAAVGPPPSPPADCATVRARLAQAERENAQLRAVHREIRDLCADRNFAHAEVRLAIPFTLDVASRYDPACPEAPIPAPVVALAEQAGMTRQTASKIVRHFAEEGSLQRRDIAYTDRATGEPRQMMHVIPALAAAAPSEGHLVVRLFQTLRQRAFPRTRRPAPVPTPRGPLPAMTSHLAPAACASCPPEAEVAVQAVCTRTGEVLVERRVSHTVWEVMAGVMSKVVTSPPALESWLTVAGVDMTPRRGPDPAPAPRNGRQHGYSPAPEPEWPGWWESLLASAGERGPP